MTPVSPISPIHLPAITKMEPNVKQSAPFFWVEIEFSADEG
jgi:hypothetical protein